MKDETKNALRAIFDKQEENQKERQQQQAKAKSERDKFLEGFDKLGSGVIRPTLENIGEELISKGHGFEITQQPETRDYDGKTEAARVKMEVYPHNQRQGGKFPSLTFYAETYENKVWTHVSTMMPVGGGQSGPHNHYSLDDITIDTVESEAVYFLGLLFKRL